MTGEREQIVTKKEKIVGLHTKKGPNKGPLKCEQVGGKEANSGS